MSNQASLKELKVKVNAEQEKACNKRDLVNALTARRQSGEISFSEYLAELKKIDHKGGVI